MIHALFEGMTTVMKDVLSALTPLIIMFVIAQVFFLKLPKKQVVKIFKGILMTYAGLVLFLQGVHVGFMPIGESMGIALGAMKHNWILIPIGVLLGFLAILAEPAVRVLIDDVEKISAGHINKTVMLLTICIGVAISVGLSMLRVLTGISLWYFIVPGYVIAFVLTRYVDATFTAMAFDSGGVATGPMTVTFILSMTVGVAKVLEHRNPLMDGFGMVALVAMTPILSVLVLGFLYTRKERANE